MNMMNNCFGSSGNNYTLWILIILLVLCSCGGSLDGIFDKLLNCECLLPLLIVWMCCCNKGGIPGYNCGK